MDSQGQLRNLRDFLLVYNRMTEICFQRCTSNFNYRNLTMDEEHCVDSCAGKLIRTNHRLMSTYVQLMPAMVQKRMQEMESKAADMAKVEAAAQSSSSIADTSSSFPPAQEIQETPSPVSESQQISFAPYSTSDINTPFVKNGSAIEEPAVHAVITNPQSFTNEGLGSVYGSESAAGAGHSPQTPS